MPGHEKVNRVRAAATPFDEPTLKAKIPEGQLMHSSELFNEIDVGKMLESIGVELGPGVIPRYGLMYLSAILASQRSVHACARELRTTSSQSHSEPTPDPDRLC